MICSKEISSAKWVFVALCLLHVPLAANCASLCSEALSSTSATATPSAVKADAFPINLQLPQQLPFSESPRFVQLLPIEIDHIQGLAKMHPGGLAAIENSISNIAKILPNNSVDLWLFLLDAQVRGGYPEEQWNTAITKLRNVLNLQKTSIGFSSADLQYEISDSTFVSFTKNLVNQAIDLDDLQQSAIDFKKVFPQDNLDCFLQLWQYLIPTKQKSSEALLRKIDKLKSQLVIETPALGFSSANEVKVEATTAETISLLFFSSILRLPENQLVSAVSKLASSTHAKKMSEIVNFFVAKAQMVLNHAQSLQQRNSQAQRPQN